MRTHDGAPGRWQVRLETGSVVCVSGQHVEDRRLSIYWRMLRPEFVKSSYPQASEQVWASADFVHTSWFILPDMVSLFGSNSEWRIPD